MADLSWEEMVNRVCVAGRPGVLESYAGGVETIFKNAQTVADSLRDGIKDLKEKWKGDAAEDYFGKLEKIAKAIEKTAEGNADAAPLLKDAAAALKYGQDNMPVPIDMLDNVQGHADDLNKANGIGGDVALADLTVSTAGVGLVVYGLLPGEFRQKLMNGIGDVAREALGGISSKIDDWLHDRTGEAEAVYQYVNHTYTSTAAGSDKAVPVQTGVTNTTTQFPGGTKFPGGGGGAGVGGLGSGAFDPAAFDPAASAGGIGGLDPAGTGSGFDPGGVGTGTGSGFDPNADPLSSLAGAGGGLGDLGGAGGGLGGGLGGGAGGGLGGLPAGALSGGTGRPVAGPQLPMGLGGMSGAGAGARGAGAKGRGGMMGGGGHGAGAHAPEDERGTWLTEDEDPWGGDADAPPSVLG
ncbi:WXG100 family type VII secretion target [Dactylosporangium matsuzakiense]|uniref:WXG100 family type VII secretion target n=1 Tax=Dactylosporangium matsuzakiense TaxID=53360 RepID=UPI0028C4B7AC|nr:WXG100 family type VII secretion target [Dactylosporangium matsuzakiense]